MKRFGKDAKPKLYRDQKIRIGIVGLFLLTLLVLSLILNLVNFQAPIPTTDKRDLLGIWTEDK